MFFLELNEILWNFMKFHEILINWNPRKPTSDIKTQGCQNYSPWMLLRPDARYILHFLHFPLKGVLPFKRSEPFVSFCLNCFFPFFLFFLFFFSFVCFYFFYFSLVLFVCFIVLNDLFDCFGVFIQHTSNIWDLYKNTSQILSLLVFVDI